MLTHWVERGVVEQMCCYRLEVKLIFLQTKWPETNIRSTRWKVLRRVPSNKVLQYSNQAQQRSEITTRLKKGEKDAHSIGSNNDEGIL